MWTTLKLSWTLVLVASLAVNLALGVVNFVLQPLWRTAAVASAVAATKAQAEVAERTAVAKARSKEKAKARLRRAVVAVPFVGIAGATAFEYADYREWQEENPEGTVGEYMDQAMVLTQEVSAEVLEDLPEAIRPDPEDLAAYYNRIGASVAGLTSGGE